MLAIDAVDFTRRQRALIDHHHAPVSPLDRPNRHATTPSIPESPIREQADAPGTYPALAASRPLTLQARRSIWGARERVQPVLLDRGERLAGRLLRGARRLRRLPAVVLTHQAEPGAGTGTGRRPPARRVPPRHDAQDHPLRARLRIRSSRRGAL